MKLHESPDVLRSQVRLWRAQNKCVGFIPTMGALHQGHLSLVDAARNAGAERVVVSIYVNPTQFGESEDLSDYPSTFTEDKRALEEIGVDALFVPTDETIYPPQSQTRVVLSHLPYHLCGLSRPGHFDGVSTVVSLLFNIVEPDIAVFGQKDFQQLQVIRRMVRDLHMPVQIVGAPIVRESDGLACSSRNVYLTEDERHRATCLYRSLCSAQRLLQKGENKAARLVDHMRVICEEAGGIVDYIRCVDPASLKDLDVIEGTAQAVLAVHMGSARLLDNCELTAPAVR